MSETAKPAPDQPRVAIAEIVRLITRALVSVGVPPEDASQVAALMAESDARGGTRTVVFRLPQYVKQIQSGGVNARPNIRIVSDRPGAALVDGDNAWASGHETSRGTGDRESAPMRDWLGWHTAQ